MNEKPVWYTATVYKNQTAVVQRKSFTTQARAQKWADAWSKHSNAKHTFTATVSTQASTKED